ncbi:MAG: zinc metallopeptidase [Acetobacteraceae bacterium]|nr:zinc metallopeptidase [Acetobacteraceae bacterium]
MFWDTGFIVFVVPALIFAFWAQSRVQGAFARYSRVAASSHRAGADVARDILDRAGLGDVRIERGGAPLSDHYDPRTRVLRLSPPVHDSPSLAALGVAAHEAGHAIQHRLGYTPLALRNSILPVAHFGSVLAWPLFFVGLIFSSPWLMDLGILLFLAAVVFQVVTLPVEFNASGRALALLQEGGYITAQEVEPTRQVLSAAAMTYLAATAMAIAQLLRLLMLRGRRD